MKALKWTAGALLLLMAMACTGKSAAAQSEEGASDSIVAVPESDTLVFEQIAFKDSSEYKARIVDYSSDEEPLPYEVITVKDTYEVSTLKAVAGKPEVVEFINQWLTLDANPIEYIESPVTAEKVAKVYAKLKKEGVTDVHSALKAHATAYLTACNGSDDPEVMPEMSFESSNEFSSSIEVFWQTPNLLTLWDSGYDYNAGAAHGMPWGFGRTFDLKKLRILTLDDIIKKESRNTVLKMIIATMKEEYADSWEMANEDESIDFPANDPSLMKDGVAFDYGAYEIGAYALGMPQALIPYDKIKPYLTEEVKEILGM